MVSGNTVPIASGKPLSPSTTAQLGHALYALGDDQAEFGGVCPNSVYQHRSLSYQELASSVQQQSGLLIGAFDRHETHVGALYGLADRLSIGRVVLVGLDIRTNILWRH